MDEQVVVEVKILHDDAVVPEYGRDGESGFDLRCLEDFAISPGQTKPIATGIAMAIPDGYELQIRPRSGHAGKHGIMIVNSPGTVDSNYRGEIKILLHQLYDPSGRDEVVFVAGDRIAQGVICPVLQKPNVNFMVKEQLSDTDRGAGGFGSTGVS